MHVESIINFNSKKTIRASQEKCFDPCLHGTVKIEANTRASEARSEAVWGRIPGPGRTYNKSVLHSAELKGPRKTYRNPAGNRRFGI